MRKTSDVLKHFPTKPSVSMVTLPSPWLISDRDLPNLGVLGIASYLEKSLEDGERRVTVSDLCGMTKNDWMENIKPADVYGISATTPQHHLAVEVADYIREYVNPEANIVVGGYHATSMPQHTLETIQADFVVVGDGEYAMRGIVEGKEEFLESMIGTKQDQEGTGNPQILRAQMIPESQMQQLPWPARHLVDIDSYHILGTNRIVGEGEGEEIKEGHIISSRGCPFKCGFCAQMAISNFQVRKRTSDDVLKEMECLYNTHDTSRFYFFDDIFIVDEKHNYGLCDRFEKLQENFEFDWHALARVDVPNTSKKMKALYQRMFDTGCRQLAYGVEHVNDEMLKRIGKNTTGEQNMKALQMADEVGMRTRAQLIVGLPGETDETVDDLIRFIEQTPINTKFGVHVFVPLPGSPVWTNPEKFPGFEFHRTDTFKHHQTIGMPGEWAAHQIHKNPEQIYNWAEKVRNAAKDKNAYSDDKNLEKRLISGEMEKPFPERSNIDRALYANDR